MIDETVTTVKCIGKQPARPPAHLRLVIPGGEGHLGRFLARRFRAQGHEVFSLTRKVHNSTTVGSRPGPTIVWDGENLGPWMENLEDANVLINLSGRSVDCRYNPRNREEILQSRLRSTAVLGKAIQKMSRPPRLWLNASTATIYRHSYDRAMDEATGEFGGEQPNAPASWRFSVGVAQGWEQSLFAAETPRTRKIAMRTAMVMSASPGGIFEVLLRLVRTGFGGPWGSGRQYMSWIHEEDFFRAVEYLIQREEIRGAVNLAAPRPLPNSEFMSALRGAWGIHTGLPAKEWMLTVGAYFLRTETELLLKSRRVVPGVLQSCGFGFRYPDWPAAARDLVQKWREFSYRGNL